MEDLLTRRAARIIVNGRRPPDHFRGSLQIRWPPHFAGLV